MIDWAFSFVFQNFLMNPYGNFAFQVIPQHFLIYIEKSIVTGEVVYGFEDIEEEECPLLKRDHE
jgi:hypothetical protein